MRQRHGVILALILALTCLAETAAAQPPGTVRAWGDNSWGQLGNGTQIPSSTPVSVTGISNVAMVSAGYGHSLAMKPDGTVWTWGNNYYGQLGNGNHTDRSTPVSAFISDVVSVSGGGLHSLALKSNGTVWAWGSNQYGQLGNIGIDTGAGADSTTPVAVTSLTGVVAIAAGGYHSLAVKSDGTVWAWGQNQYGQLGNGTNLGRSYPVQVLGLSSVVAVAAGEGHSLALRSNGEVMAWGWNVSGQLGNATFADSNTPVAAWLLPTAVAVDGGFAHSVALKQDGTVWNWGTVSTTSTNIPVQVSGLSDVVTVIAGFGVSYALKTDGTVWYWAIGCECLLKMDDLSAAVKIATGMQHSVAVVNPIVGVYPTGINFGTINTGSSSAAQNVTITNIGPDPLVVTSVSLGGANPGDFSLTGPTLPITVPMYSSTSATVSFTPTSAGARSATLIFGDNGFQAPHVVNLSGTGYTPPPPADVAVSQSVTQSGGRLTYTIIVRNNGPGSAANVTLRYAPPAQTQFVSIGGPGCFPPGSLAFGTCNMFTLASGGQKTVSLVVDVTATAPAQISNTTTVSSTTPDNRSGNNSSTLVTSWTPAK